MASHTRITLQSLSKDDADVTTMHDTIHLERTTGEVHWNKSKIDLLPCHEAGFKQKQVIYPYIDSQISVCIYNKLNNMYMMLLLVVVPEMGSIQK